jgi:RNA polymerase sigma-B factor
MTAVRSRPSLAMRVTERPPSDVVVRLTGVADYAAGPMLRAVLFDLVDTYGQVVVDLTDVSLLDGHGVGILVATHRRAPSSLSLSGATGRVRRVLEVAGYAKLRESAGDETTRDDGEDRTVETLLRARLQQGADDALRDDLRARAIEHAYGLAAGLARRYRGRGEPVEDLTQAAMIGLIKAVDGFDPDHGSGFTAYAVPTIIGELKRYFRDKGWHIRVPRRLQEMRLEINTATDLLGQRLGHAPTVAQLAAHLGATEEDVLQAIEAAHSYRLDSLSAPVADGGDAVLADHLGESDAGFDAVENRESLRPLIAALPARQRAIVALRFYGNLTQSQIAATVGVSQMHVSRLLSDAIARLRKGLTLN